MGNTLSRSAAQRGGNRLKIFFPNKMTFKGTKPRVPFDVYRTPPYVCDAVCRGVLTGFDFKYILEPGCGENAPWLSSLIPLYPNAHFTGVDVRPFPPPYHLDTFHHASYIPPKSAVYPTSTALSPTVSPMFGESLRPLTPDIVPSLLNPYRRDHHDKSPKESKPPTDENETIINYDVAPFMPERTFDLIVGNPPYREAEAWVRRSLDLLSGGGLLVFLLELNFMSSVKRCAGLFREYPYRDVYAFARRVRWFAGTEASGRTNHAIYVWQKGWQGLPVQHWLNWSEK